jgi:D-alanine-D-alanine ligase
MSDFGKVIVLMGGESAEREISLVSGGAVLQALVHAGINAVGMDAVGNFIGRLIKEKPDRVFIMLHGRNGEDGKIQAVLELLGIPYTGSGVLASALAMDKIRCKRVWQGVGLPTPAFELLTDNTDLEEVLKKLGTVFVKPVKEGSSIGIGKANNLESLSAAYQSARQYDSLVMAEAWIQGKEFTVTILDDEIMPVIELRVPGEFYDFHAKYKGADTEYLCPCDLDMRATHEIGQLAFNAYKMIGCRGWGRVDIMQDLSGKFWLLEVNTVPGMTDHSLVPMSAKQAGLSFEELVLKILSTSDFNRRDDT